MPIYEYQCKSCSHTFDQLQKLSDEALKDCPECKKPDLTKLISSGGLCFMGHGWVNPGMSASAKKVR